MLKSYFAGGCVAVMLSCTVFAADAPKKGDDSDPSTANKNVGTIYTTPHRIQFSDGKNTMYVWVACVMADGQTPTQLSKTIASIASAAAGAVTAGTAGKMLSGIKDSFESIFDPIFSAIALKPGDTYCYHIKFKDNADGTINLIYPMTELANNSVGKTFATNSYLKRYTKDGVDISTFVMNDNQNRLPLEYPACGHNSCPCLGQFCGVFSYGYLNTQTTSSDPVVAASVCVEWQFPDKSKTQSVIISFGALDKIGASDKSDSSDNGKSGKGDTDKTDADKKQADKDGTDKSGVDKPKKPVSDTLTPVKPDYSFVAPTDGSCEARSFLPADGVAKK